MLDLEKRKLLGDFVRSHRERLKPERHFGRRRTPGLRREDLADRAGISATWCAWIEQGREVHPSPQALARLATALELTRPERAYLFQLAGRRDPDDSQTLVSPGAPQSLAQKVESLPVPAYGLDPLWNACVWNVPAESLFEGWLTEGCDRNLLRFVFLQPSARDLIADWEDRALRLLAEFRADYGQAMRNPAMSELIDVLRERSDLFRDGWRQQMVLEREGGERRFHHPRRGPLLFQQHTFRPSDRPDHKLVVLHPVADSHE